MPREHGVDLDELVRGDLVAGVRVELEVGPVRLELSRSNASTSGCFWRSRRWTTSRIFVGARCTRSFCGKRSLAPKGRIGRLLVELLLPVGDQPSLALEPRAEGAREARRRSTRSLFESTYCETSSTTRKSVSPAAGS